MDGDQVSHSSKHLLQFLQEVTLLKTDCFLQRVQLFEKKCSIPYKLSLKNRGTDFKNLELHFIQACTKRQLANIKQSFTSVYLRDSLSWLRL